MDFDIQKPPQLDKNKETEINPFINIQIGDKIEGNGQSYLKITGDITKAGANQ